MKIHGLSFPTQIDKSSKERYTDPSYSKTIFLQMSQREVVYSSQTQQFSDLVAKLEQKQWDLFLDLGCF